MCYEKREGSQIVEMCPVGGIDGVSCEDVKRGRGCSEVDGSRLGDPLSPLLQHLQEWVPAYAGSDSTHPLLSLLVRACLRRPNGKRR